MVMQRFADRTGGAGGSLVLELRNTQPITAADLSDLLGNLAQDYQKFSRGHDLVVSRIVEGSLIVYLRDALELIGATNNLIDFAGHIKTLIGAVLGGGAAAALFRNRRGVGVKTVESLAKLATSAGARINIDCRSANGEHLSVEIEPPQAQAMRAKIQEIREENHRPQRLSDQSKSPGSAHATVLPAGTDMGEALARLARQADASRRSQEAADDENVSDTQMLLNAFAEVLTSNGLSHILENVALDLDEKGQSGAAQLVREAAQRATKASR